jgi:hypothetical protein
MHSTIGPALSRGHLSRHERQELARAEALSRRAATVSAVPDPVKLAEQELSLIDGLVRRDRTAVSTALLVIAGIGGGEARRRAVIAQVAEAVWRARDAQAISSSRADQIARHVRRALESTATIRFG